MADKKPFLVKQEDELAMALGHAVWAFARIERVTFTYLKLLSDEPLDMLMSNVAFDGRLAVMRKLLGRLAGKDEAKEAALQCIDRANKLKGNRNLIVHNPWAISANFTTREFEYHIEKVTEETKRIALHDLNKFTVDCERLHADMEDALVQLAT